MTEARQLHLVVKEARGLDLKAGITPDLCLYPLGRKKEHAVFIPMKLIDGQSITFNYEANLTLGDIGPKMMLLIANRDEKNKALLGEADLRLKDLKRGIADKSWVPLKPKGELYVEMVALNFGKIDKPGSLPGVRKFQRTETSSSSDANAFSIPPPRYLPPREYKKGQIKRMQQIAKGTSGIVYKGFVKDRKEEVAIKDISVKDASVFEEWKKEVDVMSQYQNDFVVEIYGFAYELGSTITLTIVMEYMHNGSLFDMLHGKAKRPLPMLIRVRMASQCAMAVAFLHSNTIMHRDIKSLNIMVNVQNVCKLADFGSAKFVKGANVGNTGAVVAQRGEMLHTAATGTPLWMAPEVRNGTNYGVEADTYSLGILLFELFEERLPSFDFERQTIVLESYDFLCAPLVLPMLNVNPGMRPPSKSVAEVLTNMVKYVGSGSGAEIDRKVKDAMRSLISQNETLQKQIMTANPNSNPNPQPQQQQPQQQQYQPQPQSQSQPQSQQQHQGQAQPISQPQSQPQYQQQYQQQPQSQPQAPQPQYHPQPQTQSAPAPQTFQHSQAQAQGHTQTQYQQPVAQHVRHPSGHLQSPQTQQYDLSDTYSERSEESASFDRTNTPTQQVVSPRGGGGGATPNQFGAGTPNRSRNSSDVDVVAAQQASQGRRAGLDRSNTDIRPVMRDARDPSNSVPSQQAATAARTQFVRNSVRALYDYEARTPTELTIKRGEILSLHPDSPANPDWVELANSSGTRGWVPKAYVL